MPNPIGAAPIRLPSSTQTRDPMPTLPAVEEKIPSDIDPRQADAEAAAVTPEERFSRHVALTVSRLRAERGLSLREAARLTGVSAATLSLIENGRTNPTVTLLWKIANAFKVSFTSLVEPPKPAVSVVRGADMPVVEADGGRFRNHPLFSFDPAAQFEIYRIEMDPGAALGSEPHPAGTQEYLTIFSGEVEVTVEEASFRLSPGDAIRFPADCRHGYRAVGSEKVELSMVILYA